MDGVVIGKKRIKKLILQFIGRFFTFLGITLVLLIAALYGVMWVLAKGPSPAAGELFVRSVRETSAIGFLANWFYTDEEIAAIISPKEQEEEERLDTGLIDVPQKTPEGEEDGESLEILDITGATYRGKMLVVKDPSRVFVGVSGAFGEEARGITVQAMTEKYGAVAGTNAGGFQDENGMGSGGVPIGMVISEGEWKWGNQDAVYELIGFDNNNILHVGKMSGREAIETGIRDAVCFGPTLIVNGKPRNEQYPLGGGLNPRTAIGQKADGTVLLLVIDGSQASSLGATYDDLVTIMLEYGAVNAANLDGGSSAHMIYEGELITTCSSLYGPREMPTSILIR